MENFENIINLDTGDKISNEEKDFKNLIQKLEAEKSIFLDILKGFSEEDRSNFDVIVLNPRGLSWGVFNSLNQGDADKVLELIDKFKSEISSDERKEIGKQIASLIE